MNFSFLLLISNLISIITLFVSILFILYLIFDLFINTFIELSDSLFETETIDDRRNFPSPFTVLIQISFDSQIELKKFFFQIKMKKWKHFQLGVRFFVIFWVEVSPRMKCGWIGHLGICGNSGRKKKRNCTVKKGKKVETKDDRRPQKKQYAVTISASVQFPTRYPLSSIQLSAAQIHTASSESINIRFQFNRNFSFSISRSQEIIH